MEFNQFNLYAMNAGGKNDLSKTDEVDRFINDIRKIDGYTEIKNILTDKFGIFDGEKWINYDNLHKQLYLLIQDDKIEVCALKNDTQYFGLGWKLVGENL